MALMPKPPPTSGATTLTRFSGKPQHFADGVAREVRNLRARVQRELLLDRHSTPRCRRGFRAALPFGDWCETSARSPPPTTRAPPRHHPGRSGATATHCRGPPRAPPPRRHARRRRPPPRAAAHSRQTRVPPRPPPRSGPLRPQPRQPPRKNAPWATRGPAAPSRHSPAMPTAPAAGSPATSGISACHHRDDTGPACAAAVATRRNRACACTLRTNATWSMRGHSTSLTYRPAPRTSRPSSFRRTAAPNTLASVRHGIA